MHVLPLEPQNRMANENIYERLENDMNNEINRDTSTSSSSGQQVEFLAHL